MTPAFFSQGSKRTHTLRAASEPRGFRTGGEKSPYCVDNHLLDVTHAPRRWGSIPLAVHPKPRKQTREDASLPHSHALLHIHPHNQAARLPSTIAALNRTLANLNPDPSSQLRNHLPQQPPRPLPFLGSQSQTWAGQGVPLAISQDSPLRATHNHNPQTFVPVPPGIAGQTPVPVTGVSCASVCVSEAHLTPSRFLSILNKQHVISNPLLLCTPTTAPSLPSPAK